MKTQHTPGPWKHERMLLGNAKDRRSGFIVNGPDANPLPVRICDIRCTPESPFAVSEANARLIAAAPELLAALKLIYANAGESPEWIRARLAPAISKAEGGAK